MDYDLDERVELTSGIHNDRSVKGAIRPSFLLVSFSMPLILDLAKCIPYGNE
jgi:hypothetical protein